MRTSRASRSCGVLSSFHESSCSLWSTGHCYAPLTNTILLQVTRDRRQTMFVPGEGYRGISCFVSGNMVQLGVSNDRIGGSGPTSKAGSLVDTASECSGREGHDWLEQIILGGFEPGLLVIYGNMMVSSL